MQFILSLFYSGLIFNNRSHEFVTLSRVKCRHLTKIVPLDRNKPTVDR